MKSKSGFTIVEVLVVVIIISVLTGLSILGYQNIQRDQRDTKRMADMLIVQNELQKYYESHGEYPASMFTTATTPTMSADGQALLEKLTNQLGVRDPIDNNIATYRWGSTGFCDVEPYRYKSANSCLAYFYWSGVGFAGPYPKTVYSWPGSAGSGCNIKVTDGEPFFVLGGYSETNDMIVFVGSTNVAVDTYQASTIFPNQQCFVTALKGN